MEQAEVFRFTIDALERLGITYFVVGSVASMAYGEPRSTMDIDIVIEPTPAQLDQLCDAFPDSDFYVSKDAARSSMRQRTQFNVIHPDSGNKIDFIFASGDQWSREQISGRRRLRLLPDKEGFAAGPEHIIIGKLLYYKEGGSEKHLRDVAGMMKMSGERVDRAYVERWVAELDLAQEWQAVLTRLATEP
jgi:hypothetical protein